MACFGAVQARAELGVLSAARTSSTTPTADTVPAAVPENRQMSVVGRPKEPILHYCVAVFKLYYRNETVLGAPPEKPQKIPVFSPSHVGCRFAPSAPRLRRYAKN